MIKLCIYVLNCVANAYNVLHSIHSKHKYSTLFSISIINKTCLILKHTGEKAAVIILHVHFPQYRHSSNSPVAIRQSLQPLSLSAWREMLFVYVKNGSERQCHLSECYCYYSSHTGRHTMLMTLHCLQRTRVCPIEAQWDPPDIMAPLITFFTRPSAGDWPVRTRANCKSSLKIYSH